ncbi:unnamed protein product [Amoebophrya sp. A120]|nr:unnamed protein product [Amoebophrya sp. A120]|eukprot:GSA120T00001430001.1
MIPQVKVKVELDEVDVDDVDQQQHGPVFIGTKTYELQQMITQPGMIGGSRSTSSSRGFLTRKTASNKRGTDRKVKNDEVKVKREDDDNNDENNDDDQLHVDNSTPASGGSLAWSAFTGLEVADEEGYEWMEDVVV